MAAPYEIRVVNMAGANPTGGGSPLVLTNANVTVAPTRQLNDMGSATFTLGLMDAEAVELRGEVLVDREVQFWRDGVCEWWGKVTVATADMTSVTFACKGLLWYFSRRFFGPNTTHFLANGNFEDVDLLGAADLIPGWTKNLVIGRLYKAGTPDFFAPADGDQSAGLVTELAFGEDPIEDAAGKDSYIQSVIAGGFPEEGRVTTPAVIPRPYVEDAKDPEKIGQLFVLKGWYQTILTNDGTGTFLWTGPAAGERGLYIERRSVPGGVLGETQWAPITQQTDIDEWVRLECYVVIPAGRTEDLVVRLYCPGIIWWDSVSLTTPVAVGSLPGGTEVAEVMRDIVMTAAQEDATKTDLLIAFAGTGGPKINRVYNYEDHGQILSALAELADSGYADFDITWNATGTTRTFNCYPATA